MKIEPGTVWEHYKGKKFVIVALARLESTSDVMRGSDFEEGRLFVVYHDIFESDQTFARPISEWCQGVGEKKAMRFSYFASSVKAAESRMRCE